MAYTQTQIDGFLLDASKALHRLGTVGRDALFNDGDDFIEKERDLLFVIKTAVESFRFLKGGTAEFDEMVNFMVSKYTQYNFGRLNPIYEDVQPSVALNSSGQFFILYSTPSLIPYKITVSDGGTLIVSPL